MVLVIMDHLFNLMMSYNYSWSGGLSSNQPFYAIYEAMAFYWNSPIRMVVRWICLASFCFLSGISSSLSRDNKKRAIEMLGLWFVIFVGSNILEGCRQTYNWNLGINCMRVDFNIIGVLAWSSLAYTLVEKKHYKWLIIIASIGLIIHPLCVLLAKSEVGQNIYAPALFKPADSLIKEADHMPLFPYLSFFFLGALLGGFTYSKKKESYFKRYNAERPICFLGRHSLIIYIAHFIILIALFAFIDLFI